MSDLNNDLRLAINTGSVALGHREVMRKVNKKEAQVVVIAEKGRKDVIDDIVHVCNIAGIKLIRFHGNSLELGTICGKPYTINSLAVVDQGNSKILNENY